MPTKSCPDTSPGSKIPAQTLFLGSSVVSFNASMGWGGEPSSLTVSLVDDHKGNSNCIVNSTIAEQLPSSTVSNPNLVAGTGAAGSFGDDHYHTCTGDSCYVNENGANFDSNTMEPSRRMVPGKVYYQFNTNTAPYLVSKYWFDPDPGFFGQPNRINSDNSYVPGANATLNKGYDIIGTPVVFKMGSFRFAGLVHNWTKQDGSNFGYNVTVYSMQHLLSSCHLILDSYGGCVYSKPAGIDTNFGGPRNYTGNAGVDYCGHIYQGNIPNVFNIYGFLESFGVDGFGGSLSSTEGISVNAIIDALGVLTSCTAGTTLKTRTGSGNFAPYGKRTAFSPFGRILAKCMQENDTYAQISNSFDRFGVIPPNGAPQDDETSSAMSRCQFLLDLSDIPRFPNDFRLSGMSSKFTITDLLNHVGDKAGFDYYVDYVPTNVGGSFYNILKVRVISRKSQPRPYDIESTVNQLKCDKYNVTATSIGKEANNTNARTMIIGGPIQRLYQAKSLRLAYTQSNHIFKFDPIRGYGQFIDYMKLGAIDASTNQTDLSGTGAYYYGKLRIPAIFSNHNRQISNIVNPALSGLYDDNNTIQTNMPYGIDFDTDDDVWSDQTELSNGSENVVAGNYLKAIRATHNDGPRNRFFPLYNDVICPFFGFVQNEIADVRTDDNKSNVFRRVRPVWFDTWTGQIVVVVNVAELPLLSVTISNANNYCIISESEIRAAIAGFDEYLIYSLAKTFKPDLIEMVRQAYITKSINGEFSGNANAEELAREKHAWYWNLLNNIQYMGSWRLPWAEALGEVDGTHNIDPAALSDLQILHKFVASLGENYGKKYMVRCPTLSIYKASSFSHIALPTSAGTAYVFNGGGQLRYSYTPTNDGAWEEYGNTIDDCIVIGGNYWYNLIDNDSKIRPLLGYNASNTNAHHVSGLVIPSLNYSNLAADDYVLVDVSGATGGALPQMYNQYGVISPQAFTPLTYGGAQPTSTDDAFGDLVLNEKTKKLFVTTDVNEEIVFLDPENLQEPRIIINSPGISLYSTHEYYGKDLNRSILANIAMEDLAIYLFTTASSARNTAWTKMMSSFIYNNTPIIEEALTANKSASYATLSPKMAHPHFAGIPLRSNTHRYGPWINYPYAEYLGSPSGVFPSGTKTTITGSQGNFSCASTGVTIDQNTAKAAIDNWIVPTHVDFNDEYVPWNYGGNAFLDAVAISDARDQSNYQNILENAQVDILGLPLFSIGSPFNTSYRSLSYSGATTGIQYTDTKRNQFNPLANIPIVGTLVYVPTVPATEQQTITYNIPALSGIPTNGAIITNIQCNAGPGGITSTYSFRTYARKLGFFNKENSDRIKAMNLSNIRRNKQLATLAQRSMDNISKQAQALKTRDVKAISSQDFKSKLFGWSPSKVLIGQAYPFMNRIKQNPDIFGIAASGSGIRYGATTNTIGGQVSYIIKNGVDLGDNIWNNWNENNEIHMFSDAARHRTDVGLFEEKEVNAQLIRDYGSQAVMSLDGIFSPVSFYPTFRNSTYNLSYYNQSLCPFCSGTKKINVAYSKFYTPGTGNVDIFCKNCVPVGRSLQAKLKSSTTSKASKSLETLPPYIVSSGTDLNALIEFQSVQNISSTSSQQNSSSSSGGQAGISIPINLVSLQPIVVPYGEFKNPNVQFYSGVHPEGSGIHGVLTAGGSFRSYHDRCRHSIEVVGRGGVFPKTLNIVGSLNEVDHRNYNYDELDARLKKFKNTNTDQPNNQRFLGLRGPLILHSWGYDLEGYPVPNAADEPYDIDSTGRYKRFKITTTTKSTTYQSAQEGDVYVSGTSITDTSIRYIKQANVGPPNGITDTTQITIEKIEDDLTDPGGFDPVDYQGSVISKTQQFTNGKWTPKKKLKQFYLNWAEHPEVWPVGPIDLRWDEDRKIWATKSDSSATIYKMVYVTLEEDLVKDTDSDETYPARAFLDDIEYSGQPLPNGARRLIFVKDKTGYTAPRGAKLLCRYSTDTGFYEPITKQSFVVGGILGNNSSATIQLSYITGRKRGEPVPTMLVTFDNPFGFNIILGNKGLFTFMNGKWTLTAAKET